MLIKQVHQECIICYYWYFLDKMFKCQPDVCNGCHDVLTISMNLNDTATLNIKGVDYIVVLSMGLAKVRQWLFFKKNANLKRSGTL